MNRKEEQRASARGARTGRDAQASRSSRRGESGRVRGSSGSAAPRQGALRGGAAEGGGASRGGASANGGGSRPDAKRGVAASKPSRRPRRRWPFVVFGVVVALAVAAVGSFSAWRWALCNDAADLQGSWYVVGSTSGNAAQITSDSIELSSDVSYTYALDGGAKTLAFDFGSYSGSARYRFSLDRQTVAIQDGDFTWDETLLDDIAWSMSSLVQLVQGNQASPAFSGADALVLTRSAAAASAAAGAE